MKLLHLRIVVATAGTVRASVRSTLPRLAGRASPWPRSQLTPDPVTVPASVSSGSGLDGGNRLGVAFENQLLDLTFDFRLSTRGLEMGDFSAQRSAYYWNYTAAYSSRHLQLRQHVEDAAATWEAPAWSGPSRANTLS